MRGRVQARAVQLQSKMAWDERDSCAELDGSAGVQQLLSMYH